MKGNATPVCSSDKHSGRGSLVRSILISVVAAFAALTLGSAALAAPAAVLGAAYGANPPATAAAGSTIKVPITLLNTGDETWNAAAPNPVNLSYHWYRGGAAVVWEGVRTA